MEASLRERSKEVKEQLSKYKSESEKERDQLKRDEAIDSFKALLIDLIKSTTTSSESKEKEKEKDKNESKSGEKSSSDHHHKSSELSWKEAKKILKKDARWSHCKSLEKEKKEQLFNEHMCKFRAKKRELFYQLLADTSGISMKSTTWKEAKKLIKSDPRYEKLSNSETFKLEKEFEVYMNEKFLRAKADFKDLLVQTKLITFKTYTMLKEQASHMKEIEDLICNDKSYTNLNCAPEERKKMLLDYIEMLHSEGPPPPPTATEPIRRK